MNKFFYFEFIVIYFLTLVPWPHPSVIRLLCSKDNTRLVRKLIQSKWIPILEKYQVKLPLECPLHPLRDVFEPQQDAKKRNRHSQWTCKICGKSFYEEKFIDLHFENRHKNLISKMEDAVCLADFCDIMRCEVFLSQDNSLSNGDSYAITDIEVWGESSGHSSSLAQAGPAYVALMPLRKKNSFFHSKENTFAENSRDLLPHYQHFCEGKEIHDSDDEDDESKNDNPDDANVLNNKSVCDDENITNSSSEGNNKSNEQFPNMQKIRATCRPEELQKLKLKCEILIRTCITGLLLEMSDYAFKEMEDELNKAVCWYLSCDRYWEDGPLEPRAFPWGLILVLVMVLSLGICFCYYIIWILFDSEETVTTSHQTFRRSSPRYSQRNIVDRKHDDPNLISSMALMACDPNARNQKYADDVISSDANDLAHNEHYIYVTYPPDLKRRLLENYE